MPPLTYLTASSETRQTTRRTKGHHTLRNLEICLFSQTDICFTFQSVKSALICCRKHCRLGQYELFLSSSFDRNFNFIEFHAPLAECTIFTLVVEIHLESMYNVWQMLKHFCQKLLHRRFADKLFRSVYTP